MASSLLPGLHRPPAKSCFPFPFHSPRRCPSTISSPRSPFSASVSSSWEREEQRWLREEQRWMREEQRWLREEARWSAEREILLREISSFRLRIEALERDRPGLGAVIVADSGSEGPDAAAPPRPPLVEETQVKEMILEEVRVSESAVVKKEVAVVEEKKQQQQQRKTGMQTLRTGSEGHDVRAMQEALQRLGFYSGEEDMEYSYFSSGTERAVKTWQASLGAPEDGIMTAELLERLLVQKKPGDASSKDSVNGPTVTSIAEKTEIQQKIMKDNGDTKVDISQHRVFLLGENRWEEPSRLIGRDKPVKQSKPSSLIKCPSCRGEGRLMCTECEGTGEPNVEPQFLEWVGEGAKCPYCEGLGYTVCDVCEGKTTVEG